MAIVPNNNDEKRFNDMLNDITGQVLPNKNRISNNTIAKYLNMDIRKVRILVIDAIDMNKLRYEFPLRVNDKNRDASILQKIHQVVKKNILPYKKTF